MTKEILEKAAQENRNLLDKWDARFDSGKRKSNQGQGKRKRQHQQKLLPAAPRFPTGPAPQVPITMVAPGSVVSQPAPTYQHSPVVNQVYEGHQIQAQYPSYGPPQQNFRG